MSKLAFKSNEGGTGTVTLQTPVVDTDVTITLPSKSGVITILEKDIADFKVNGIKFGTTSTVTEYTLCSNSASTAAKTVTVNGFVLEDGAMLTVIFGNGNTAANPTLNVNGTGAKTMIMCGANINATTIKANDAVTFVYDNGYYRAVGGMAIRDGAGNVIATTYLTSSAASNTYATKTALTNAQTSLNTTITNLTNRVATLESSMTTVSNEISTIKSTYMTKSEYQSEIDAAYAALS